MSGDLGARQQKSLLWSPRLKVTAGYKIDPVKSDAERREETANAYRKHVSAAGPPGWQQQKSSVMAKTGGRCAYCGKMIGDAKRGSVDHVLNGVESWDNLLPACQPCNSSKGMASLAWFRLRMAAKASPVPVFTRRQLAYLATLGCHPPRLTGFRLWFETAEGTAALSANLSGGEFGRLEEFVRAAGSGSSRAGGRAT